MENSLRSGVYRIINLINLKVYYGSAVNIQSRFKRHKNMTNTNRHLRRAFNKHGIENFSFEVIYYCEIDKLLEYEQILLDLVRVYRDGELREIDSNLSYNISPIAGNNVMYGENHPLFGKHLSEEVKNKMAQSHIYLSGKENPCFGKHHSEETKKKIGEKSKGRIPNEETRIKMSKVRTGRKHSEESKKKMSAWQIGRKFSEESKEKMSVAKRGKKLSEEHIKNLTETNRRLAEKRIEKSLIKYNEIYKEILKLKAQDLSIKEIMEKLNLSRDKYYRIMKYCETREK